MKERIKEIRKSMRMTQQQFADKLGLKRQTIAAYEVGNIQPSKSTIRLICKEYDINEKWLSTGEGEMKSVNIAQERYDANLEKLKHIDDETIIRWVNMIAEVNPSLLKNVENFMITLLEKDGVSVHRKEE